MINRNVNIKKAINTYLFAFPHLAYLKDIQLYKYNVLLGLKHL